MERSVDKIEDELLVIRCKRGDQAAWNELIARWSRRLMYFVGRLVNSEHDVANILQETWMNVFKSLPKLREESRLAPWLYTLARRSAMKHLRSAYATIELPSDDIGEVAAEPQSEFDKLIDNVEAVHLTLMKMPLNHREVMTLYFLDDLSVSEIAEVLGIPPGTVKSRLYFARKSFRETINGESQL